MPRPTRTRRAGRNDKRMMQTEWRPELLQLAQEIKQHAEASGITAGQFAVSWVLNSSFVSGVIAGPRTEEQWDDYLRALDYRFTAEDEALIDRLVTSGHPSTPGFNDPAYPIEGRRARTSALNEVAYADGSPNKARRVWNKSSGNQRCFSLPAASWRRIVPNILAKAGR